MARVFCLFFTLPSPVTPYPLYSKQKFLIKVLQNLRGQKKCLRGLTIKGCHNRCSLVAIQSGRRNLQDQSSSLFPIIPVRSTLRLAQGRAGWERTSLMVCLSPLSLESFPGVHISHHQTLNGIPVTWYINILLGDY